MWFYIDILCVCLTPILNKGSVVAANTKAFIGLDSVTELAKMSDLPSIPDIPDVVDNLTSSSTTDALSANQGRALKSLIGAIGEKGLPVISNGNSANFAFGDKQLCFAIGKGGGYNLKMSPNGYVYEITSSSSGFYNRGTITMASGSNLYMGFLIFSDNGLSFGIIMHSSNIQGYKFFISTGATTLTITNMKYTLYQL